MRGFVRSMRGFVRKMKLPVELEEEILFRVPPLSLARFRTVCKRWNTLFDGERFVKNHLACVRPQFILHTESKIIYSIGINPDDSLDVYELNLDSSGPEELNFCTNFVYCNGFLLCPASTPDGDNICDGVKLCPAPTWVTIWNPWLREETKCMISNYENGMGRGMYDSYGLGYDNCRPDEGYKMLGFDCTHSHYIGGGCNYGVDLTVSMYDFATNKWKVLKTGCINGSDDDYDGYRSPLTVLSLNGTLYWIASKFGNWINSSVGSQDCFIQSFDFSEERFKLFCLLPCKNDLDHTQILAAFKGDRFSVLEQCHTTRKIEIWVTKNKISSGNGEDVSWIKFMTTSIPDLPKLQYGTYHESQPSYFIDNNDGKRLIVCTCDDNGMPYIYVVNEDKFKKISLDFVVDRWPYHLVYVPSLVPIPSALEEQGEWNDYA